MLKSFIGYSYVVIIHLLSYNYIYSNINSQLTYLIGAD